MLFLKPILGLLLLAVSVASAPPTAPTSLRDKIAQLILLPCFGEYPNTRTAEYRKYQHWVRDLRIGGLIVINRVQGGQVQNAEPYAMAAFLNRMQRLSGTPLLVAADFERGASMRVSDTTKYPYNMAFAAARDVDASRDLGAATAKEARALGVHWIFAPDADINNNPDNPIINIRSYGENPQEVAAHVQAFIEGAHSDPANRVLVTAKHFPGHGDTAVDSHMGLARLDADRARLDRMELIPFRAAIQKGVDSVMTAHMTVPALDPEEVPATVSSKMLTGLLRNELKFQGIIVTDAMDMQGLTKQFNAGEASVRALEAGNDVLLMPPQPEESIRAILAAVQEGRLSRKRIDQSFAKVIGAKTRLGLFRKRTVDVEGIGDVLDSPEAAAKAQAIADRAVTIVKDEKDLLPMRHPENACLVVLTEGRYSRRGRTLVDEVRRRAPDMKISLLDPSTSAMEMEQTGQDAMKCGSVVIAAFVTVGAYRGSVGLDSGFSTLVNALVSGKAPVTLISFGNPYLIRNFPGVTAYVATFSTVSTSEVSAAKMLFGESAVTGHLPVTIPGIAKYGDGIQIGHSSKETQ